MEISKVSSPFGEEVLGSVLRCGKHFFYQYSFPSPFGEEVLESCELACKSQRPKVSIPFRGRGFGKHQRLRWNQHQREVSIPFRGRGFGKSSM